MLRLRTAELLLLAIFFLACSTGKPPASQSWAQATGAEAYERLWWKAIQEHDSANVERHLAPIFVLTTTAGIVGREQAVQYFQSLNVNSVSIGDLTVQPEGPDMVVSYTATLSTAAAPRRYYMTTVWQQAKQGWIAITHAEVPAEGEGTTQK